MHAATTDYDGSELELSFTAGSRRECGSISITRDDVLENNETFSVSLNGLGPSALVTIIDNNSTCSTEHNARKQNKFCLVSFSHLFLPC